MGNSLQVRIIDRTECTEAALDRQNIAQRHETRARLGLSSDDVTRMVAEFAASRGIKQCKPAYAALSHQYSV